MPRKVSHDIIVQMYQAEVKNAELDKRKASAAFRSFYDPSVNVNTTFTFGYASVAHNFRRTQRDSIGSAKSDRNGHQPSTSSADDEESYATAEGEDDYQNGVFFLRYPDRRILPIYCERPLGIQVDAFLKSIPEKYKDRMKKFVDKEKPDDQECYLWIQEEGTSKTTVVSLKTLENHFKNEKVKRVNWRHLSVDKMSVYRYSLPVVTTKFRLRVAHFMSRHYRCCILGIWCAVILLISLGITLSVVFGATPHASFANITAANNSSAYISANVYTSHDNRAGHLK
ncbi:Protein H04M03.12 [Aphelenchoides avenae]|nr:Protein H04M03.12 [Aphelenchus avenae]